jgi:hypothetical protein
LLSLVDLELCAAVVVVVVGVAWGLLMRGRAAVWLSPVCEVGVGNPEEN